MLFFLLIKMVSAEISFCSYSNLIFPFKKKVGSKNGGFFLIS